MPIVYKVIVYDVNSTEEPKVKYFDDYVLATSYMISQITGVRGHKITVEHSY